MRRASLIIAVLLIAAGIGLGAWRVVQLEARELEYITEWQRLAPTPEKGRDGAVKLQPHRELGRVKLAKGEDVTFEVCAQDQLEKSRWVESQLDLVVWIPAKQKIMVRRPFDAESLDAVTRGADGACLIIAQGSGLTESGEFAVEAIWSRRESDLPPELSRVPFRLRVMAFREPAASQRWPVVVALVGAVLLVLGFTLGRRQPAADVARPSKDDADELRDSVLFAAPRPLLSVVVGLGALIAAGFGIALLPLGGSLGGFVRALVLATVQILVVLALVRPALGLDGERRRSLGLSRPRQGLWILFAAPFFGVALWALGQAPLRLIPATAESPVGAMVAWPSGSLAVALASVLSPVVEEVFFRGFVYGSLAKRYGTALAFTITVCVFAVAHLPQTWGAWGGFAAVTLTGIGLTALRSWTGSIVVPALAHLTHNTAITLVWVIFVQG